MAGVRVPPFKVEFKMQRGSGTEPPRRQLRATSHVASLYAMGSSACIVTPKVGKTEDEQTNWKSAHEVAVACAVNRMRRSKLARSIVRWLSEEATKALIAKGS